MHLPRGTIFEWYDFYLYGSLAAIFGKQFFAGLGETTSFILALAVFAAGFAVRPFGALVFGRLGDLVGRKYTFLVTILLMGASTFLVGILPGSATIGQLRRSCLSRCGSSRAWRLAANMAARPMWRSMHRIHGAASTPLSSRPRQRLACSCRCW